MPHHPGEDPLLVGHWRWNGPECTVRLGCFCEGWPHQTRPLLLKPRYLWYLRGCEEQRGFSIPCLHLLKLVVNCLLKYPLCRRRDYWSLFLCEVSGIISTKTKAFSLHGPKITTQGHLKCIPPPLKASFPLQGGAEPTSFPEHQATRGQCLFLQVNITD